MRFRRFDVAYMVVLEGFFSEEELLILLYNLDGNDTWVQMGYHGFLIGFDVRSIVEKRMALGEPLFLCMEEEETIKPHSPSLCPSSRLMEFGILFVWGRVSDALVGKIDFVRVAWFFCG